MNFPDLPYLKITKKIASIVVGAGISQIVKGNIENNTSPEKTVDKLTLYAATVVVGAMASRATSNYTDSEIDKLVAWWGENVSSKFKNEEETLELETLEPTEIIAVETA